MVSIARSLPASAPRAPPPHYQTYLTPLLHRRFARACLISLIFCYLEALFLSERSSIFWMLFPVSRTGVRCVLLFFLTAMPVLVLRIAHLHVAKRADPSPFHAFLRSAGSFTSYTTTFTYVVSSGVFTLLYLLSCGSNAQLGVVIEGRSYERPRLNERFIYLVFFSVYVGTVQGVYHIAKDRTRVDFPEVALSSHEAFKKQFSTTMWNAGFLAAFAAATSTIAYLPFRAVIWANALSIARHLYWLNRSIMLPPFPVGPGLFLRSSLLAFLICWSAEIAHLAFNVNFVEDPFISGKAVSDKSTDPNGTLLTGLRTAKAPLTQSIAFWELNFIAGTRPDRRTSIFKDMDRKPANMWDQVLQECLRVVNDVEIKLTELLAPSKPRSSHSVAQPTTPVKNPPNSPSAVPASQNNVLVTTGNVPGRSFVEKIQSPPGSASGSQRLLPFLPSPTAAVAAAGTKASVVQQLKDQLVPLLGSRYGRPFRQTVQLTTTGAIPCVRIQVDVITALGRLVCASLEEDEYGRVQENVGKILQSFCATLETLEKYVAAPPIHWTDTEAIRAEHVVLEEPEILIHTLKSAIADITRSYGASIKNIVPADLRAKLPQV